MTSYEAGYRDAVYALMKQAQDSSTASLLNRHAMLAKQQASGGIPAIVQGAEAPVFDEIKNNKSGFPDLTALNARQSAPGNPDVVNREAAELVSPERFARMTGAHTTKSKLDRLLEVLSSRVAKKSGK